MFGHKNNDAVTTGTVVSVRKAAVETFLVVETGNGQRVEVTTTRPRFDSFGIANGTKVVIGSHGNLVGTAS